MVHPWSYPPVLSTIIALPHNYLYNYGKTIRKKEALDKLALPKVCRKNSTTPRQPFFKAGIKK
jgi:hypothetical protein